MEIFQSRIPIRYLSQEAACLLPCYYVGRSSSAHNKITINEAMLAHQFIINNKWYVHLKSRLKIEAKIIMHRTNFHPWPQKKDIKACYEIDFGDASLRLIVGPIIVIIVVIIGCLKNNRSRWFKKIITLMVMLVP